VEECSGAVLEDEANSSTKGARSWGEGASNRTRKPPLALDWIRVVKNYLWLEGVEKKERLRPLEQAE